MPRSRKEMEQALAESFGYPDYASFREGVAETLGKGVLRRLEKELEQMTGEAAGPAGSSGPAGPADAAGRRMPGPDGSA